jgi:hypothetical protein
MEPLATSSPENKAAIEESAAATKKRAQGNDAKVAARPVDHTYTDYAPVSDAELRQLDRDMTFSMLKSPTLSAEKKKLLETLRDMPSKPGNSQSFPIRLYEVVSNPELSDIITWMPHGRSIIVHDPDALVEVLPRYFNQTKFLSFVRQLNLWGFKRLTREVRGKAYYHELFLRGRPYMALRIKRHRVKGNGCKPIPNPAGEPNFFSYPPLEDTAKPPSPKDRSKKQIMMQRAETAVKPDSVLVAPAIPRLKADAPPTITGVSMNTGQKPPEYPFHARAPPVIHPQPQYATGPAQPAALAQYSNFQAASMPGAYRHSMIHHPVENRVQRLAQLQREQEQADLYRQLLGERHVSMNTGGMALPGFETLMQGRNTNYQGQNTLASTQFSLDESLREAEHLEKLAAAARERARYLAMQGAVEAQSRYDMLLKNHQEQKK